MGSTSRKAGSVLAVAVAIGACSGSGGENDALSGAPSQVSTGASSSPPGSSVGLEYSGSPSGAGIWIGKLSRHGQVTDDAICLMTATAGLACTFGELKDSSATNEGLSAAAYGTFSLAAGQPRGAGHMYAAPGHVLADGISAVAKFSIASVTFSDQYRSIEMTWDGPGGPLTISADFDHYYRQSTSILEIGGVYRTADVLGDPASFAISGDGSLFLQTAGGCVGTGKVVLDTRNIQRLTLTIEGCPELAGHYEGMSSVLDFTWVNDRTELLFAAFNDSKFVAGKAVK